MNKSANLSGRKEKEKEKRKWFAKVSVMCLVDQIIMCALYPVLHMASHPVSVLVIMMFCWYAFKLDNTTEFRVHASILCRYTPWFKFAPRLLLTGKNVFGTSHYYSNEVNFKHYFKALFESRSGRVLYSPQVVPHYPDDLGSKHATHTLRFC